MGSCLTSQTTILHLDQVMVSESEVTLSEIASEKEEAGGGLPGPGHSPGNSHELKRKSELPRDEGWKSQPGQIQPCASVNLSRDVSHHSSLEPANLGSLYLFVPMLMCVFPGAENKTLIWI